MQRCVCRKAVIGMVGAMLFFAALQVHGEEPKVEKLSVSKTYNNAPFEYQIRPLTERAGFQVYRLTYPSPVVTSVESNNTIPADYYLPKSVQPGAAKYPAVICLHILNGDEQLTDLVCSSLATRGIPAISFKLPYYGSRGLSGGPNNLAKDPKMLVRRLRTSAARSICWPHVRRSTPSESASPVLASAESRLPRLPAPSRVSIVQA